MRTLKEIFSDIMGINLQEINDNSSPENISSWDSFNALMLVSELEKNFNIKFTVDEVMSVKNYKEIKEVLRLHNVNEGLAE